MNNSKYKTVNTTTAEYRWIWVASVGGALALSSMLSFAADTQAPAAGGGAPVATTFQVTLEKFRDQCTNPLKSEVQRAPQDIKLVCRNQEVTWVATAPGEVPLKSVRTMTASLVSDKFRVAEVSSNVDVIQRKGSCQRYQEVVENFATEVAITCDEVINHKGPIEDICTQKVDESKDKNESAIQLLATGRVIDTCGNLSIQQK